MPEELVRYDIAAQFAGEIVSRLPVNFGELIDQIGIRLFRTSLELAGAIVLVNSAVVLIAAGFGDDVDDTSERLSVLGIEATGLDLNLFDEIEIDTGSEVMMHRTECARGAEAHIIQKNPHNIRSSGRRFYSFRPPLFRLRESSPNDSLIWLSLLSMQC